MLTFSHYAINILLIGLRVDTILCNFTHDPPDFTANLALDKKFFFQWGKTRVNLTKYLIEYNKNNSHWSNVISIDEDEDKEVFERYHDKQGDDFLDEMIKELDEMVQHSIPIKFRIVYDMFNKTDIVRTGFERMMRVRNLVAKEFEEFEERRILKLPIAQKRYFRSLFFYNCNLENVVELRDYIRSYFKLEDDIDEDMKVQARNLRKIQGSIFDSLHNQFYMDYQKQVELQYLARNKTEMDFTRASIWDHKTKYYSIP